MLLAFFTRIHPFGVSRIKSGQPLPNEKSLGEEGFFIWRATVDAIATKFQRVDLQAA